MLDLLVLIFLLSALCILLGLVKPSIVIRWGDQSSKTRKNVAKVYGIVLIVSFVLICIIIPKKDSTTNQQTAAPAAQNQTDIAISEAEKEKADAEKKAAEEAKKAQDAAALEQKKYDDQAAYEAWVPSQIESICKEKLRDNFIDVTVNDNIKNPGTKIVSINFKYENLTASMTKKGMIIESSELMEKLFTSDLPIQEVVIFIKTPLIDQYGNSSLDTVMKCSLNKETAAKINWENRLIIDFPKIFNQYWEHPALRNI